MKTLLWLGNPFFFPCLKDFLGVENADLGGFLQGPWRAVCHYPAAEELLTWQDCIAVAGAEPDMVIVGDTSRPPFVLGVEKFPCLTVLYAVDTHIHSWLPWYGQAFDICLVSLKDHLSFFRHKMVPDERVLWSPPYALSTCMSAPLLYCNRAFAAEKRPLPCVFVGSTDANTMPLRHHFLQHLGALVPQLRVIQGYYSKYYPFARIVVNICEQGDLNFRNFESMGCGAALVTPAIGNGLNDLFEDGKHVKMYEIAPFGAPEHPRPLDEICAIAVQAAESAAGQILQLLRDDDLRQTLARHGCEEVKRAHMAEHRVQSLVRLVQSLPPDVPKQRCAKAGFIRNECLKLVYLHWSETLPDAMGEAYIKAARGEL